tara:strand:- start:695 stop:877 length:183 start_codon:yes stop_codon:yes gene_type:complete
MTLKELQKIIEKEIEEEGDQLIHVYDSKGYTIDNLEFGCGLSSLEGEFTFFRDSDYEDDY